MLASPEPLDLLIVIAPLASDESRAGTRIVDGLFDRVGREALKAELSVIRDTWPNTDVVVFRPDPRVLAAARPNPLSVKAAVPSFLRTLMSMRDELSNPATWEVLKKHLGVNVSP